MLAFSACSKTSPKVSTTESLNYLSEINVSLSSTIVIGSAAGQNFTLDLSCERYVIDIEFRETGQKTWKSAKKHASSGSDLDCSDGVANLVLSPELFSEGLIDLEVRQVFPFGYSKTNNFSIIKSSTAPELTSNPPAYLNTNLTNSYQVEGTCGIDNMDISYFVIPDASYASQQTNLELESVSSVLGGTTCLNGAFSFDADYSGLSLGLYKIVIKYKDVDQSMQAPLVNTMEFISAPLTGLSWSVSGGTFEVLEGANFSSGATVPSVSAAHPDPSAIITYSVSSTTCASWNSEVGISSSGVLSGLPDGYGTGTLAVEENCTITVAAVSRSENLSTSLNINVNNNYCSSGNLETTCVYGSNVTLPNGLSLYGGGSIEVSSGVTVSTAPKESINIALSGNVSVLGSLNANISSLSATTLTVGSGGEINATSLGEQGIAGSIGSGLGSVGSNSGEGAGHAGIGGEANCVYPASTGGNSYGSVASANTMGSSGNASGLVSAGGHGGGLVSLNVGSLIVDGSIMANGGDAAEGGGGSGGSINIVADSLSGNGVIGVSGGHASTGGTFGFGGGSGGYINVSVGTSTFSGTINIDGGWGSSQAGGTTNGASGTRGQAQITIASICDSGDYVTACVVSNTKIFTSTNISLNDLTVTGAGKIQNPMLEDLITISSSGAVTFEAGSIIESSIGVTSSGNISVLGSISAAGKGSIGGGGCQAGTGSGGGQYGDLDHGGGAHFSNGGDSELGFGVNGVLFGVAGTVTYGSGGAGGFKTDYNYVSRGGNGGGVITLESTSGNLLVDGSVNANGENAYDKVGTALTDSNGGGGAGGYISLTGVSVSGTGSITANGGDGGQAIANFAAGGGGFGYIEIVGTDLFSGTQSTAQGLNGY